jgi:hypothetical protein
MPYEKAKIVGVREVTKKATGERLHFLQVELLQSYDIYLNEEALKQLPAYAKLKGKEALIPVVWGEYNGKPSLNLADDFAPLPAPVRNTQAT